MLMCAHAFPTIHPQWISIGFALARDSNFEPEENHFLEMVKM